VGNWGNHPIEYRIEQCPECEGDAPHPKMAEKLERPSKEKRNSTAKAVGFQLVLLVLQQKNGGNE